MTLDIRVTAGDGSQKSFKVLARLDTPNEVQYYRNGGILQYVLRQLAGKSGQRAGAGSNA